MDIEMASTAFYKELPALVAEGKVPESLLDEAVLRILELKDELGLFENPYKDADEEMEKKILLCNEHRTTAREAAARSCLLYTSGNSEASAGICLRGHDCRIRMVTADSFD